MQQVLQNIRNGQIEIANIPAPIVRDGEVLIANMASIVSAGTEKMVLELSRKSLLGKARARPDHVKRVLEKIRQEGLFNTIRQVREKLDSPMNMGYSSAGIVLACGSGVQQFKAGDHVASNGPHAEIVAVPKNLCARVPDGVDVEQAAFAVLGAIALQGVRLSHATLGETVFVIGLGLIGQLAVGILSAAGCRVIGTDLDNSKCELALRMGASVARPGFSAADVEALTKGIGADAVLITASTQSNGPIQLAAGAVRKKGRVVLVGVVGLELDRRPFYFKEAEFVVSCSYGPGRYDPDYEDRGRDYPAPYVRWTEQRNIEAVLELMGRGKLDVRPLISHRFPIERALNAYELIDKGSEPYLGIVLQYPEQKQSAITREVRLQTTQRNGRAAVGVLGAGNFARMVLLPAIKACPQFHLSALCSAGGVSAVHSGTKLGFERACTDEAELFCDPKIDAIFSITRHDQHQQHVLAAIRARKAIFVEKPLCLTTDELLEIDQALEEAGDSAPLIMVGFNRRFSAPANEVKQFFSKVTGPLTVSMRFNAGAIPADHWTQDLEEGGGRIIGEACHGIDLVTYLVGSLPVRIYASSVGGPNSPVVTDDQCFITVQHANGSLSSIAYLAGGDKGFSKERIEVFGGGRVAVIDDFRELTTCANGKQTRKKYRQQDKGHRPQIRAFAEALTGGAVPIPWSDIRAVSLASILAVQSMREGLPFEVSNS